MASATEGPVQATIEEAPLEKDQIIGSTQHLAGSPALEAGMAPGVTVLDQEAGTAPEVMKETETKEAVMTHAAAGAETITDLAVQEVATTTEEVTEAALTVEAEI